MITCAIFRLFPCLQPQIPRETNISLCRCPAVKHHWWVCEYRRKWHFFHLTNATIGHQCLGFHTLRTWPKSFPQFRWVQDFWITHDKIWNHHVKSWPTCFFCEKPRSHVGTARTCTPSPTLKTLIVLGGTCQICPLQWSSLSGFQNINQDFANVC